jgi:hypothetical protein
VAVPEASPRIEPLTARHDRSGFACGKEALDQYFQRQVTQDARRHLATPFVMVMPDGVIGGFYTLSSTALRLHDLPEDFAERLPRYPLIPATLISRLAIDRRLHGQGWGSFLFSMPCIAPPAAKSRRLPSLWTQSTTPRAPFMYIKAFCRCPIRRAGCSGA